MQHETRTETQQEYQMSYEHTKTVTEVSANEMVYEKKVFIQIFLYERYAW